MGRTLIGIIKATILVDNIDDKLWIELVLAMTYIKNSWPIKALADTLSFYKTYFYKKPDLSYLQILGSIVYILLQNKKRSKMLKK